MHHHFWWGRYHHNLDPAQIVAHLTGGDHDEGLGDLLTAPAMPTRHHQLLHMPPIVTGPTYILSLLITVYYVLQQVSVDLVHGLEAGLGWVVALKDTLKSWRREGGREGAVVIELN